MCNDHGVSRRQVLRGAGAVAAAAALAGRTPPALAAQRRSIPAGLRKRPVTFDGTSAFSNAMHIHSSFSEFTGSMDSHLSQATLNSVDVLWWTEHAYTLDGKPYRDVVHFTSLNGEKPPAGQGSKPWRWDKRESGPNSSASTGGVVTTPSSPNDPVSGGALALTAKSTSTATAKYGFLADAGPDGWNYRDNLNGQSVSIDVMLEPGWSRGYLEILITTSYHPASGGRPAGTYSLSYRIVPSGKSHRTAQGRTGIVTIPVPADGQTWTTVTVAPAQDIAALWPDLDFRDFAFYELYLRAASTGDLVTGYFDYLRFDRTLDGGELFIQQGQMAEALAAEYPAVTQYQGLEVSLGLPHINWFGGTVTVPTFDGISYKAYPGWVEQQGIPAIHQSGGLASWNHPFGYSWTKTLKTMTEQDMLLQQVAAQLLPARLYGCDILEVGYPKRAGVDLAHHVALWDILSRNAVFITGNGTSDDHWGDDWAGLTWNWNTTTWAASPAQGDLLAALAAGRAYCGSMAAAPVALDMLVDGKVPMGAVSVSSLTSRSLTVTAAGLPAGSRLRVFQGDVDYAGTGGLSSNAVQVASFGPAGLNGSGQATLTVDTSKSRFLRTQVVDSAGKVQGLSNPVWLLDSPPPNGIPAPRQA
jgi:hypothetical protein